MSDYSPGSQSPTSTGLPSHVAGALAYIFMPLSGIVFFLIEKDNQTVRFHAAQSMVVGAGLFVANIALMVLGVILGSVPLLGWLIASLLSLAFGLACFVLWVMLMVRAFQGAEWELPVAGEYARRLVATPATHV